ncbi:disease resistance protein L6-like [Cryptomeria japonica]|uniref:disease resistance protein L6-like n=1 Tax=Cryptomeria japonica TaxID=3369 RepID=UPI0027D9FC5C|nr:disease resistance protein L6-like [Cryptomeria japonica]
MRSMEMKGSSYRSGAPDVLSQIYKELPYFPSVDGAKTFLGDFWHYSFMLICILATSAETLNDIVMISTNIFVAHGQISLHGKDFNGRPILGDKLGEAKRKKEIRFFPEGYGYEARLVKTLVNDIIRTLDRVPLQVAKYPVELDNVKNVFIQKLNLNSVDDVVKIGIWGVGGIGKTTVAKAVYNQIYSDFEAASFVFNVCTNAADSIGLTNVQKQLLEELTRYDGKVHNVDKGISLFRDRLRGKRLLLILDDVDTIVQFNSLVGDWLVPGSRIIITSRDKHILNVAGIPSSCIHEMNGLEINEGLQLFSWHAFLRTSPSPSYEDLTKRIVKACKGHPLSLEVIGSYLYDKQDNIGCWTDALRNIILNPEIHERLYISYSALSDDEKEMFVDIACFFIGENKRFPIVLWKSLYRMVDSVVCNLSMKLLIKIDDRGIFDMHDHLQDMGRLIAEKEKRGTRLWEKEGTRLEKAAHSSTVSNINFSRLRLSGGNLQRLKMMCRPGLCYLHL